jgi:hypothetical protein
MVPAGLTEKLIMSGLPDANGKTRMPAYLPRVSGETNEVGWITSKRYVPYVFVSFAISLVLCWLFWFALYAVSTWILRAPFWDFSQEDADFLRIGLGMYLATLVTPLYGILWLLDEVERATTDRNKVREFFGQKSWGEIVKLARKLKGSV